MNSTIEVLAVAAMDEETAPFLEGLGALSIEKVDLPFAEAWHVEFAERDVVVLRSGVGLVNAATAATAAIAHFQPQFMVSAGSAGGLAEGIFIGDVVVGTSFAYAGADASPFGYALGQIPGMPEVFQSDEALVRGAMGVRSETGGGALHLRPGKIISWDVFTDARHVEQVRANFPGALAADMESTALAHVAHLHKLPFVSVRGISDLCGQNAEHDFGNSLTKVAHRSATVLRHLITTLPHD